MKRFMILTAGWLTAAMSWNMAAAQEGEALAILIPGGGTYSRPISTMAYKSRVIEYIRWTIWNGFSNYTMAHP